MLGAADMIIQYDNTEPRAQGTWKGLATPQGRSASLCCPNCGQVVSIHTHAIDIAGGVTPSVYCPHPECDFHAWITLEGWRR